MNIKKTRKVIGELLGEEVANDFFHIDDERFEDDVHEECCMERCSVQEIAEYSC